MALEIRSPPQPPVFNSFFAHFGRFVMPEKKPVFSAELAAFLAEKDFAYGPEPELYGGLSGFYSYGTMGKRLKNNLEAVIRRVFNQNGFFEIEYPIVAPSVVWKASGHLDHFNDPIVLCSKCKSSFRADKLLEENGVVNAGHLADAEMLARIKDQNITCPNCKGRFNLEIQRQSLMMRTTVGADTEAYNRPETATTTYLPFKRYHNFFRGKFPFSVFQIGKAFRNEISPRQHMLRMREFTQAEAQVFVDPLLKNEWPAFESVKGELLPLWTEALQKANALPSNVALSDAVAKKLLKSKAYAWSLWLAFSVFVAFGIPREKMRLRQHHSDEKAFYADDAWDLEIELTSFGWTECCGIHDRTDYDLKKHAEFSKQKLVGKRLDNSEFVPHVLEIAFGVDRPFFALCDLSYDKRDNDEQRITLHLPSSLAPIQVAVFALMARDGLDAFARNLHDRLQKSFLTFYDESGSIGRRYARMDSVGTPYCITVDYDSLKNHDATVRERDSMKQERVKVADLEAYLRKRMAEAAL